MHHIYLMKQVDDARDILFTRFPYHTLTKLIIHYLFFLMLQRYKKNVMNGVIIHFFILILPTI